MSSNSLKWEGGTFTLSTIKETSQEEWVSLVMKTQLERAILFGFTESKFEAKLNKIWTDVNGAKKPIEEVVEDTASNSENIRKGNSGKPKSARGTK